MEKLYRDRSDAGRRLVTALEATRLDDAIVVGLARGGVPVAAEVARARGLPLDALAVRKVGHPWQPEYALGAVAPGRDGVYIQSYDGLDERSLEAAIARAKTNADALDRILHGRLPPLELRGRTALLVDDGLATGSTMVAAVRTARSRGAARVVVAVPVGAAESVRFLRLEADDVICPYEPAPFGAVGCWYVTFPQVDDELVLRLLDQSRAPATV